jgi:hypothetical protein
MHARPSASSLIRPARALLLAAALALGACGSDPAGLDAGPRDAAADAGAPDAGPSRDAALADASVEDATSVDAEARDVGAGDAASEDADTPDAELHTDASADDAGEARDAGASDGGAPATDCLSARGVCTFGAAACSSGGGTVASAFDGDCLFSDGAGTCCIPPAPAPSGDSCADQGGICTPVGGCLRDEIQGHLTTARCPNLQACCVPAAACPEPRPNCCGEGVTFRASCVRGDYVCFDPSLQLTYGACP